MSESDPKYTRCMERKGRYDATMTFNDRLLHRRDHKMPSHTNASMITNI